MIIWLNGTYGVGKTSVAREIQKQLSREDTMIFDPDELFQSMDEKSFLDMIKNDGGMKPQNNKRFLNRVIEELKKYLSSDIICIVPMALTLIEGKEIVWDYVSQHCSRCFHFVLEADESVICERIKADLKRTDKSFALQEIGTNVSLINKYFQEAIRIDTNNKKVEDVAQEIIQYVV